jgi:hypothetical protein
MPNTGRSTPNEQPAEPNRTAATGTHSQEEDGSPKPKLPHERDENHESQQSAPRKKIDQARKDVERGLEETDLYASRGERTGKPLP